MDETIENEANEAQTIAVPIDLLIEAQYQALRTVFSAALAQGMATDPLAAKQLFNAIAQDVDRVRNEFIAAALQQDEAVEAEAVTEEE